MHSKLTMKNRKRPIFMCESTDLTNRKRKRTIYELSRLKTANLKMNHSEVDQRTETDVFKSLSGMCASDSIGKNVDNLGSGELQYDQLNIINYEGTEILDSNSINNDVSIKKFGSTFVSNEDTKEVHVLPDVNISQTYPLAKSDRQLNVLPIVLPTTKEIKSSDHIYVSEPKCKSSSPTDSKIMSAIKVSKENDSADNTMDRNFLSISYCNSTSAISNSSNINISNAVKSQSVMNAKTVMSEITQTTAKVSIGNTTISVPLLKPVCSSKIVQDSVDIYKNQIKIKPQVHPQQGQPIAHVNPKNPAVVSLRRGQKLNPPTIVSLSQLQIKPSNNAKIVQATVVSNKLQLKNYTDVITQSTVNISSIRGKPNYTRKLCYPKQANMVNQIAVRNKQCVDDMISPIKNLTSHSISKPLLEGSGDLEYQASISNDNLYNINTHVLPLVTKVSVTNRSKYLDSTAEIQKKQYLDFDYSAIVIPPNKAFASETQPILSSVSKTEITNIPLQKFKNTPREIISQHDTSSTSGATMSNITTVFATSTVPITQRNNSSSQAISCSSNNLSYNTVSNVPQTISLVLSKTTANETSSTVLPVSSELSIQNQANRNFTNQFTKENQFPKMITLKKTGSENSQHDITKSVPLTPVIASSAQFYINQNSGIIDLHCSQVKQETSLNKSKQIPNSPTELNIEREKPNQSTCTVMRKDVVDKTGVKFNCIKNKSEVNRSEKKKRSSTTITSVCDGLGDSTCLETIKQNNKKKFSRESPPRTEESQNILLKQLLKNTSLSAVQGTSSIATSPSSMCNQALSNRKINVRAPSLGLVSSLEAQLARPVMPPVSASTGLVVDEPLNKETEESSTKLKQSMPLISKETSFVSNPRFCSNVNSNITSERISPHTQEVSNSIPNNPSSTTDVCIPDLVSYSSPTDGISNLSESCRNVSPNGGLNKARGSTCFNLGNEFRCDKRTFPKASYTVPENYIKRKGDHQSDTLNVKVMSSMEKDTYFSEMTNASVAEANNISLPVLTQVPVENVPYEKDNKSVKGLTTSSETICKSHILDYFRTGSNSKNYSSPSKFTKNKDKVSNSLKYSNNPKKVQETNESIPEAKQRKKRKRDFHKQHTLSNNTETSNAVEFTNSKKRMRKPGRVEEDYDIFMDNLLNQMRKMASLDVLEPLLCNNKGICNMYGFSDLSKLFRNKEYENSIISKILNDQNQQWIKVRDFYEEQPFGCNKKPPEKKHLMQNNFYDQEFLADTRENVEQKFYKVVNNTTFHNNMDSSEHVFAKNMSNYNALSDSLFPWDTFTHTTFPGLVVINDDNLGRQSPVIPLVKPVSFKFGSILPPPSLCHPKRVFRKQLFISKFDEEENNLTVILTISSDEVLSVLKDLANILNISPISSYTIIEDVIKSNVPCSHIGNYKLRENQRSKYNDDIQDILNGVKKLCENCGFSACKLACMPFVALKNSTKNLNGLETSADHIYFCSKACCINFKYQLMSRSLMEVDMPQNFKELINKSGFRKHKDLSITSNLSNLKKPRFKYFKMNAFQSRSRTKNISRKEITNILFDLDITMLAPYKSRSEDGNKEKITDDIRRCILCNENGDGISNAASRLLNIDVNKWVHLNCALWSNGVYETISGGLMNVEAALQMGKTQICSSCHQLGATIRCFKIRCESVYHLLCAKKEGCIFYKNKSFHCRTHSKTLRDNELLTLEVQRRVFIEKDESHQIINIMRHQDRGILLRIGSIILLNVGKLLPHQMDTFHSTNCIYPIGYKTIRFYWSLKKPNTRCRYICTLSEISNRPEFTVRSMDSDLELRNSTATLVWLRILESIVALKKKQRQVQIFPKFISGDDLFGFTEPFIVRILESLPGVEILTDYRFKYGRSSLLELPLGIHSSGAARTEPQQRQVIGLKKPHTQRTATTANQRLSNSMVVGEVACPYSKQFVHSKSSQYKKMNQEWRNNVYLARSKIQGLGLYAARDLEKHTMVIEYIGEVIRTEVSEMRERQYGARNRGIYMFRLDEDRVVDATLSGGLARYINHSCNPNCVTEIVDVDREVRIIIFAKRRISRGEELSYDYKFDIEDDANKLPCMCGALNCRKWMN